MGRPRRAVGIAVYGLGTVGSATVTILQSRTAELAAQYDLRLTLRHIVVREPHKARTVDVDSDLLTTDHMRPLDDPAVEIVVELMGGLEPAGTIVRRALAMGKAVVTANKALIAAAGAELEALAKSRGTVLRYEGSVAGAIPVIHTLRGALVGNRIRRVRGILNGTTNYILSRMSAGGTPFDVALRDAQVKGFAEADPSADVSGLDAAQKLVILARHAFGEWVHADAVEREGIERVTPADIADARAAGESVKLIAEAARQDGTLRLRVAPTRVPAGDAMAGVQDEYNAVQIEGDFAGSLMFIGRGAGGLPTGSAVYDDVVETARGRR